MCIGDAQESWYSNTNTAPWTQVGPGPEKVPLSMRSACLRWVVEGRENLVRMSAIMSSMGHQMMSMEPYLIRTRI